MMNDPCIVRRWLCTMPPAGIAANLIPDYFYQFSIKTLTIIIQINNLDHWRAGTGENVFFVMIQVIINRI